MPKPPTLSNRKPTNWKSTTNKICLKKFSSSMSNQSLSKSHFKSRSSPLLSKNTSLRERTVIKSESPKKVLPKVSRKIMKKIKAMKKTKTSKEFKVFLTRSQLNGTHSRKSKRKVIWKITSSSRKLEEEPMDRSVKSKWNTADCSGQPKSSKLPLFLKKNPTKRSFSPK